MTCSSSISVLQFFSSSVRNFMDIFFHMAFHRRCQPCSEFCTNSSSHQITQRLPAANLFHLNVLRHLGSFSWRANNLWRGTKIRRFGRLATLLLSFSLVDRCHMTFLSATFLRSAAHFPEIFVSRSPPYLTWLAKIVIPNQCSTLF